MELYNFLRGSLAWAASIAVLWPLNVPLMALAYKVRNGPKPVLLTAGEFWTRATFAALVIAVLTLVIVGLDYSLAVGADLPAGPVHLVMLVAYVASGMWVLFVFLALDDLMQGVSVFVIYLCLPIGVFFVINLIVPFWQPLVDLAQGWLKEAT